MGIWDAVQFPGVLRWRMSIKLGVPAFRFVVLQTVGGEPPQRIQMHVRVTTSRLGMRSVDLEILMAHGQSFPAMAMELPE